MDILAARKKAAEQAKAVKAPQAEAPRADEAPGMPAAGSPPAAETASPDTGAAVEQALPQGPLPAAPEQAPSAAPGPAPVAEAAEAVLPDAEEEESGQEAEQEMLAFLLGSEEYLLPVELVGEVLTPREITSVPHAAPHVLGVCSLRGAVLPVIDLNRRLGLAEGTRDERSRIIVITLGPDDRVGLFVDRVRGVVKILPSSVRPTPETIEQGGGAELLSGIARKDDRLYILLDVRKTVEG